MGLDIDESKRVFINHLKTKRRLLYLKIKSLPRSKNFLSRL